MRHLFYCLVLAIVLPVSIASSPAATGERHDSTPDSAYALRQENGRWWLVRPSGQPFFSLGVCCVTQGDARSAYNQKNPGYAAFRHYPSAVAWADTTLDRLRTWGFTTVGGWSDLEALKRSTRMDLPFTLVLHMGMSAGAPWWDMWDPKVIALMEEIARKQIEPVRNDPHLLGYYTDNEMGWWNAPLLQMTLEEKPGSEQRGKLLDMLRQRYGSDWQQLTRDFEPQHADSFPSLEHSGTLLLRPGGRGLRTVRAFAGLLARRYYALCRQIIRKYDRRGLILGDRYQSFYFPEVARASGEEVDAVSTNVNANWPDGSLTRFYLDTLYHLARRPVMVGEFYLCATENRSGDKNNSSGFPVVPTQKERAVGFCTTLNALAHLPFVTGADWFQYADEPGNGRGDGENYNMGLVDIEDRPYEEITLAARAADPSCLHAEGQTARPDARRGVPPLPAIALAALKPGSVSPTSLAARAHSSPLLNWDRERGFVPCRTPEPTADLYVSWDLNGITLGLHSMDIVETGFYRDKRVPEIDRAEWTLQPAGSAPVRFRIGAGRAPVRQDAAGDGAIQLFDLSGSDADIHNIAAARLPAAVFGRSAMKVGDTIRFTCHLTTFGRAYGMDWGGTFRLVK